MEFRPVPWLGTSILEPRVILPLRALDMAIKVHFQLGARFFNSLQLTVPYVVGFTTRKNNFYRYFPRLTGLSVVGLVGHSLLEGAVSLDVDNVTRLVALEVCAQVFYALCLVRTREHVPRATPISLRVRHLEGFVSPLRLDQTCEKYHLHFISRQKDRQVHS